MSANRVTIGIPAYNRRDALAHVLAEIVRNGINRIPGVEILVIDDDSPDNSYEVAFPYADQPNIRVLKNEVRAGFRGNFGKLIEHCATEYLVFSCDDDFVVRDGIEKLVPYLANEPSPPALISSLFYDKGEVYRANAETVAEIELGEYRNCCAHLPGVVMNARLAKVIWPRIEQFELDPRNAYPQCCLAAVFLLLGYRCIYYPVELVRTGYDLESGIIGYATVAERWKQFVFFAEFLQYLSTHLDDTNLQSRALALLESHKNSLFRTIGSGITYEAPELAPYYIRGAADHVNAR